MMTAATIMLAFLQGHAGHGAGARPTLFEYVLVGIAIVAAAWTIYLAVRYTVRPGESNPDHIKRRILDDEDSSHD